ncbi:hypothetical protein BJ085DRAFT_37823 [Dimargaris cristalligena]|uniref:Uncharacterized protein n=1 Tax=Dimargaris cristalligena TaxID=215637 RepID=A0A4Q0A1W8_9FUNG|nr:hypothetical protein BJ085DRAFT_37823 [Dimargaris cristalligena]|eukprot:RKP40047.1 hypothetical protein BJ085DRAFT_37823 [Dimargaris cristalligena]
MSPGEFVRRMNYLVHDPVQRYIFTRDQVNLQLKAVARKLQALADASGDMKDFEANIQQFTGDFYSLAKLESCRDPPTTIKHHFGANLEITSHQMESLELTRSVLLPTLEMGFLLSVWRLYRREEIDHLVQFVQLVWNDTKVEKNGVQHIGHFLGNVIFFLLTLAAIDQKQSVLTALEPFFSTAAIYADDRRRFAQVFSVHQRKLVECLNNRGLTNAARFLHQRWGLQINLDRTWTDASCWKSLFGSTWLAFTSTGELGVGVPVNLLDPAPRLDQFLPSEYQTTFPSFRSIDRIQNKLFQDDHPVFASAWFTLKHAVDVVRGLRRWGYED